MTTTTTPAGSPEQGAGRRTVQALTGGAIGSGVLLIVLATLLFVKWTGGNEEILLESSAVAGTQPFTTSVSGSDAAGQLGAKPESGVTPATAKTPLPAPSAPPISGIPANRVGLYGGTGDNKVCDRDQLVRFLESNPAKARAWAGLLGVRVADIGAYVRRLTPTVLLYDTRVTNHGFSGGRATSRQAVLQAGTAVLVNSRGEPVVRCACGNPLTAPLPTPRTRYTGQAWPGFRPGVVVVVVVNRPSSQSAQSGTQGGGGSQTTTTTKGSATITVTDVQADDPDDEDFAKLIVGSTITTDASGRAVGQSSQRATVPNPDGGSFSGTSTLAFDGTYDDATETLNGRLNWSLDFSGVAAQCQSPYQATASGGTMSGPVTLQCTGTIEGSGPASGTLNATVTMQVS